TETRIYRFSGTAGDRVVFAPTQDGSANLRLISPTGIVLRGPEYPQVLDPAVLSETGEYLLLVEGYPFESRPINYSLLIVPESRSDLDLTVGSRIDGDIGTV